MGITIRRERVADYYAVENMVREAFWGQSQSRCDEHYVVHKMRNDKAYVAALHLVAEDDESKQIVGNIMYSKAKVVNDEGEEFEVLHFGPLSVHPAYQNEGIGKQLLKVSLSEAKKMGYPAVIIYGEPDYYPKQGFEKASGYGITTPDGTDFDAFLLYVLDEDALAKISGRFYVPEVYYSVTLEKLDVYDRKFPEKKPLPPASILSLKGKITDETYENLKTSPIKNLAEFHFYSTREVTAMLQPTDKDKETINHFLHFYGYTQKDW